MYLNIPTESATGTTSSCDTSSQILNQSNEMYELIIMVNNTVLYL